MLTRVPQGKGVLFVCATISILANSTPANALPRITVGKCLMIVAGAAGLFWGSRVYLDSSSRECSVCKAHYPYPGTGFRQGFKDESTLRAQAADLAHAETFRHGNYVHHWEIGAHNWELIYHYSNLPSIQKHLRRQGVPVTEDGIRRYLEKDKSSDFLKDSLAEIIVYRALHSKIVTDKTHLYWKSIRHHSEVRESLHILLKEWDRKVADISDIDFSINKAIGLAVFNHFRLTQDGLVELYQKMIVLPGTPPDSYHPAPLTSYEAFLSFLSEPTGQLNSKSELVLTESITNQNLLAHHIWSNVKAERENNDEIKLGETVEHLFGISRSDLESEREKPLQIKHGGYQSSFRP